MHTQWKWVANPALFLYYSYQQYFIWMDHLNRHTYRALLHQSQQTVDQNMARPHAHEKLTLTDKTMEELTQIFNRFGLTPTDMNIPWRPGSPKTGLARFDDYSDEDEPPPAAGSPTQPTASTAPVVPALELPKAAHEENKNAVGEREWGRADEEKERNLALIKVQGKFKTYHPSSWRHEIIMKKEKGIIKEVWFLDYETVDVNRADDSCIVLRLLCRTSTCSCAQRHRTTGASAFATTTIPASTTPTSPPRMGQAERTTGLDRPVARRVAPSAARAVGHTPATTVDAM